MILCKTNKVIRFTQLKHTVPSLSKIELVSAHSIFLMNSNSGTAQPMNSFFLLKILPQLDQTKLLLVFLLDRILDVDGYLLFLLF